MHLHSIPSHTAFHIQNDDELFHNLKVAAKYGKVFLVNTGYVCRATKKLLVAPKGVLFYDENTGEVIELDMADIHNVSVGMEEPFD